VDFGGVSNYLVMKKWGDRLYFIKKEKELSKKEVSSVKGRPLRHGTVRGSC